MTQAIYRKKMFILAYVSRGLESIDMVVGRARRQKQEAELSHLKHRLETKRAIFKKAGLSNLLSQWHTSFSKPAPPKRPQTLQPTGDQAFKYWRFWGMFLIEDVYTRLQYTFDCTCSARSWKLEGVVWWRVLWQLDTSLSPFGKGGIEENAPTKLSCVQVCGGLSWLMTGRGGLSLLQVVPSLCGWFWLL